MPPRPLGERAMTDAERQRRRRTKLRAERAASDHQGDQQEGRHLRAVIASLQSMNDALMAENKTLKAGASSKPSDGQRAMHRKMMDLEIEVDALKRKMLGDRASWEREYQPPEITALQVKHEEDRAKWKAERDSLHLALKNAECRIRELEWGRGGGAFGHATFGRGGAAAFAKDMPKLAKLVGLLSSDKEGEVIAARDKIKDALKKAGRDWHDLAALFATDGRKS